MIHLRRITSSRIITFSRFRGDRRSYWNLLSRGMAGVMAIILGASITLVAYYLGAPMLVMLFFLLLTFIYVALKWPEYAILSILAITSGIINPLELPYLDLGPVSFHSTDLMLFGLLAITLVRVLIHPQYRIAISPLMLPLGIFLVAFLGSVIQGLFIRDVPVNMVLRLSRLISYWVLFFSAFYLIRSERALKRLLNGIWIISGLVALGLILRDVIPGNFIFPVYMHPYEAGIERVYMPGERLLFVMLPVSLAMLAVKGRQRTLMLQFLLVGYLFWLLSSFQRNYWIATGLACLLVLVLLNGMERLSLFRKLLPMVLVGILIVAVVLLISPQRLLDWGQATLTRLRSLSADVVLMDENVQYRIRETRFAIEQFRRHPLFGIGLGNSYRPLFGDESNTIALNWYLHNAYLWIGTMMGLAGLIPFLWLCIAFLIRCWRFWHRIPEPEARAIYVGFGAAFLGTMVSNIVAPNFFQDWALSIYPLLIAVNEIMIQQYGLAGKVRIPEAPGLQTAHILSGD